MKVLSLQETHDVILDIFTGPSVEALNRRVVMLYNLAKNVEKGVIVELGTHHGYGAIALAFGTRAGHNRPVYTVDDYVGRKDWIRTKYPPSDYNTFQNNIAATGTTEIIHIKKSAFDAGAEWCTDAYLNKHNVGPAHFVYKVGLLYIDTGNAETTKYDFWAWAPHIMKGGIVAMRDTNARNVGTDIVAKQAVKTGQFGELDSPDAWFVILEKIV